MITLSPSFVGPSIRASLICVALFAWALLQFRSFGGVLKAHMKEDDKNFSELKGLTVSGISSQQQVAASIAELAKAIYRLSDNQMQQIGILREITSDQKTMIENQLNAQNNLQRLLERVLEK